MNTKDPFQAFFILKVQLIQVTTPLCVDESPHAITKGRVILHHDHKRSAHYREELPECLGQVYGKVM